MRTLTLALLSFLAAGAAFAGTASFRTIDHGTYSSIREPREVVIKTPEEWGFHWAEHTAGQEPAATAPRVNFGSRMVVGVYLGEQMSGGYGIQIVRVRRTKGGLVVSVRRRAPGPDEVTLQALTQPFHLVSVAKTDRPVQFVYAP